MLGITKDQLPNFFILHPYSDTVTPYPETLDKVENFSPDMILMWARHEVLHLEIGLLEKEQKAYKEKVASGDEIPEWEAEQYVRSKESLESAQLEQTNVSARLQEASDAIMGGTNEYADNFKKHLID